MPAATVFSFYAYTLPNLARIDEVDLSSCSWNDGVNVPGSADASIPWFHRQADVLQPGWTALFVDRDGDLEWGGIVWTTELDAEGSGMLRSGCEGFTSYLRRRWIRSTVGMTYPDVASVGPTDVSYTAVDQFRIVSDLVAHAAAIAGVANIALTVRFNGVVGGTLSGQTRTVKWSTTERKNIGAAIEELAAQQSGFDFTVTPVWDSSSSPWGVVLYLDLWYPRLGVDGGRVLEHGGNVSVLRLVRDAHQLANPLVAVGPGVGDAAIVQEVTDTSERYPLGRYPWMEDTLDVREYGQEYAGNLGRLAAARLYRTKRAVSTATVDLQPTVADGVTTFSFGEISTGDTVRMIAPLGSNDFDEAMRVVRQSAKVEDTGLVEWKADLASDDASLGGA